MGHGGARAGAVAALIGAALVVAGCGESRHPNEQRPSPSTRISVTISPKQVIVQPLKVGFGPEKTQQIPQNQNHAQPPIRSDDKPLNIIFVAANQTATDTQLKVRGARDAESATVFAHSPGSFPVSLPAGSYTITAVSMPKSRPGHLQIGHYRASSQNDVLLP